MTVCRALINGEVIAQNVVVAKDFIKRVKGLLGKKQMQSDEGILLIPCHQVHTFGMKFAIDVLFLSKEGEIIHIEEEMMPGNVSPYIRECHQILELKCKTARKKEIAAGQRVAFDMWID